MLFRYTCGLLLAGLLLAPAAMARRLTPATVAAFDHYVALTERRMAEDAAAGRFPWPDGLPQGQREPLLARLQRGEVVTERLETYDQGRPVSVPDGMIHHWRGIAFIPGATLARTLALLQDYDNHSKTFAPDVERSRLLSRSGDDFKVYLRLRRKKVVTVVLNTEYDVHYTMLAGGRAASRSYSTRIAEVRNAGQSDEAEKPVGDDSGYLWRLYSYWSFWQRDGGVYVQLEAISLTRDIPAGLGWLIRPFITSVPRESLAFTLGRTRQALCCGR